MTSGVPGFASTLWRTTGAWLADAEGRGEALADGAADACDAAILVGPKHTAPIKKGLLDSGFRPDDIKVVRTLEEATALIRTFVGNGDTVLFDEVGPGHFRLDLRKDVAA